MVLKDIIPRGRSLSVKRQESDLFDAMRRRMDDMFEGFVHGIELRPFEARIGGFSPNIDIVENDVEIRVSAELPGMEEKDIDVSISKESLTLKGEKKEEKEDKGKGYYRMECAYGSFSRVIPLPPEIDQEKVKATFRNGVLTIKLRKTEQAIKETKKITVKSE